MQTAVNTLLLFLLRYLSRDSYRDTLGNNRNFFFFYAAGLGHASQKIMCLLMVRRGIDAKATPDESLLICHALSPKRPNSGLPLNPASEHLLLIRELTYDRFTG